jgi:hypothetical protein
MYTCTSGSGAPDPPAVTTPRTTPVLCAPKLGVERKRKLAARKSGNMRLQREPRESVGTFMRTLRTGDFDTTG